MRLFYVLVSIILVGLVFSCKPKNPLDFDVSDVDVKLDVQRMERELFEADRDSFYTVHQKMIRKYGRLYNVFLEGMLGGFDVESPMAKNYILDYMAHPDVVDIYKNVDSLFYELGTMEDQLTTAFKYFHHYFPDSTIPTIVTLLSNFHDVVYIDDRIGVGMEMYLGLDNEIVQAVQGQIPNFRRIKMQRPYFVGDVMRAFLLEKFYRDLGDDLVSRMLAAGKIMYCMDAVMPATGDWIKIKYSHEEIAWARENEEKVWKVMVDQEYLRMKDRMLVDKFLAPGPFTAMLPNESPDRMGVWMGWQMVRDFMRANPKVTLKELIELKDVNRLLKFYDPTD